MTKILEVKFINGIKNILSNNIINFEDIRFENLSRRIKEYFVLDWYIKESIEASIKSEIKRYLIKMGIEQDVVDSILIEISKLLKELKEENKQEIQAESGKKLSDHTDSFQNEELKTKVSPKYYTIILDSNYLYNSYRNGGDFRRFRLNKPFYKLIEKIEEFDIYDYVDIVIPEVVYNEIIIQRVERLKEEANNVFKVLDRYKFPEELLEVKISNKDYDYVDYENSVRQELDKHIDDNNKLGNVKIVVIPYKQCSLENISNRAFYKQSPFEGKEKKSDKGFKDALIWESILEYQKLNSDRDIVFLSKDKGFNEDLELEFKRKFEDEIYIIKKEDEETILRKMTEEVFTAIGDTPLIGTSKMSYYDSLKADFYSWYDTEGFQKQLDSYINVYIGNTERYIEFNRVINKQLMNFENIEDNSMILIINCKLELQNKKIASEKIQVLQTFELRIKIYEDSFQIENIDNID